MFTFFLFFFFFLIHAQQFLGNNILFMYYLYIVHNYLYTIHKKNTSIILFKYLKIILKSFQLKKKIESKLYILGL